MTKRTWKLMLLGMFLVVTIGSGLEAQGQPSEEGQWASELTWPISAIHMIVLKNGKVLAFSIPLQTMWWDQSVYR